MFLMVNLFCNYTLIVCVLFSCSKSTGHEISNMCSICQKVDGSARKVEGNLASYCLPMKRLRLTLLSVVVFIMLICWLVNIYEHDIFHAQLSFACFFITSGPYR